MSEITLYCAETASLKLGPGSVGEASNTGQHVPGHVIVFAYGFATFDEADFPDWRAWVDAPGTPTITVADVGQVPAGSAGSFPCPECAKVDVTKVFATQKALNGHLMSHRPRAKTKK